MDCRGWWRVVEGAEGRWRHCRVEYHNSTLAFPYANAPSTQTGMATETQDPFMGFAWHTPRLLLLLLACCLLLAACLPASSLLRPRRRKSSLKRAPTMVQMPSSLTATLHMGRGHQMCIEVTEHTFGYTLNLLWAILISEMTTKME